MVKLEWYTQDRENFEIVLLFLSFSFLFLIGSILENFPLICTSMFISFTIFSILFCYWVIFKSERYIASNITYKELRIDRSTIMEGYEKLDIIFQDLFNDEKLEFQKVEQNAGNLGYKITDKEIFIDINRDYHRMGHAQYWFFKIVLRPVTQKTMVSVKSLQKIISEKMQKDII